MFTIDYYSVALLKACQFCNGMCVKKLSVVRRTENTLCKSTYWNHYIMWSNMHKVYWNEYFERFAINKEI